MNSKIIHFFCCYWSHSTLISFSMHSLYRMNWFYFVWFWQPCLLCNEMWCGGRLTVSINTGQSADCWGQMKVFISSGAQRSLRHDSQCLRPGIACCNLRCSGAITLSLTLIQQFIYWCACIRAEVSFLQGGGQNMQLPSASATSIVSQETSHMPWFIGGKPDEACFFALHDSTYGTPRRVQIHDASNAKKTKQDATYCNPLQAKATGF